MHGDLLRTLKALRPAIIVVALFWGAAVLEPTQEIWRMTAGAPGSEIDYSWLLDLLVVGPLFGLNVCIEGCISIALLERRSLVTSAVRQASQDHRSPRHWQYAIPCILAGLAHTAIAFPLWHASGYVGSASVHHHMLFHAALQLTFALLYFALAVAFLRSAREVLAPEPEIIRFGLLALAVITALSVLLFWFADTGGYRTAPVKFVLWGTALLGFLGFASLIGARTRIPIVSMGIALLIVNALMGWDDHHDIVAAATHPQLPASESYRPPLAGDFFETWMKDAARHDPFAHEPAGNYPVFIVAAEGGGIRAAILTAMVLDELRARNPNFASHLFALVGVSGGSVGVTTFALAQQQRQPAIRIQGMTEPVAAAGWQATLHHDLLSPVIGSLLGADFLSRFVPRWVSNFSSVDRAHALEHAWEKEWKAAAGNDVDDLWFSSLQPASGNHQPGLVLMTTSTTTGDPMAVSHFRFLRRLEDKDTGCPEAIPLRTLSDESAYANVPVSTAAFMSARFPIFSPAARVESPTGAKHFVDGGYYENSGVSAALDVYRSIRCKAAHARIVIIRIENSEASAKVTGEEPRPVLFDLWGPVSALYGTQSSHGRAAIRELELEKARANSCDKKAAAPVLDDVVFKLAPPSKGETPVTLSWFITAAARQEIAKQLLQESNQRSFARIGAMLTSK